MTGDRPEHAFTAVDEQHDPQAWIDVLDRLSREPAYAAYKARTAELLGATPGGRYLEVGTGTGADALELASRFGVEVVGVDVSETMVAEARRRGLQEVLVADAEALPFADSSFDGCWADRVFQHLADPARALVELVRVTKPGGAVVVVDPDYDTQVVEVSDQELARRVLRFRAEHAVRNGALAHRLAGMFVRAGLSDVRVEATTVVVRDPTALDNVVGLRSWAASAYERGLIAGDDVHAWERSIDEAVADGCFLYSFALFATAGRKASLLPTS